MVVFLTLLAVLGGLKLQVGELTACFYPAAGVRLCLKRV